MKWMNVVAGVLVCLVSSPIVEAGTVGLWLMDDLVDVTPSPNPGVDPDPPGGETLYDSSGNGLHFLGTDNFGSLQLSNDVPPAVGVPSSLESKSGGGHLLSTPSSTLPNWGTTGALTVEFWYKSTRVTPSIGYVLGFESGAGGPTPGDWGLYTGSSGSMFHYVRGPGGFTQVPLGTGASNGSWHHVAFTVDAVGSMKSYLDGALQNTAAAGAPAATSAGVIKFAREENGDGFGDLDFLMDELRISDVVLLPGNGTGAGELAWNARLVPEPSAFALAGLAGIALVAVRFRRGRVGAES